MIKRELALFLVVGSLTVMVDFMAYCCFVWTGVAGVDISKAMSFIVGTVFAYIANRFWTFGHKQHAPGSPWRFTLLYATTLCVNVAVNRLVLATLVDTVAAIQIAFLLATGVSAGLNFLGMKLIVFEVKTATELQ
jgi:putative flippase GtrA